MATFIYILLIFTLGYVILHLSRCDREERFRLKYGNLIIFSCTRPRVAELPPIPAELLIPDKWRCRINSRRQPDRARPVGQRFRNGSGPLLSGLLPDPVPTTCRTRHVPVNR